MNVKQYTLHIWQSIWWKDVSFYDVKSTIQICKKLLCLIKTCYWIFLWNCASFLRENILDS